MTDELHESVLEDILYYAISEYMQYWKLSPEQMTSYCEQMVKDAVRWNQIYHGTRYDMHSSDTNYVLAYRASKDILSTLYGMVCIGSNEDSSEKV